MSSQLWPQAPAYCTFRVGANPLAPPGQATWVCDSIPPAGWPWETVSLTPSVIGPDYVLYRFAHDELAARYAFGEALVGPGAMALGKAYWNAPLLDPGIAAYEWTLLPKENPVTIDVYRATIHAKIGTVEESVNVLHYISEPEVLPDSDGVATFAAKAAVQWSAFFDTTNAHLNATTGITVKANYASTVAYDEVRAAHVQIVDGHPKWVGDTHFEPITGTHAGTGFALPPQIAMALSLGTSARGRSKRGRTYLGPLSQACVDVASGMFKSDSAQGIAAAWQAAMLTGMLTAPNPYKLVILSPKTDARYLVTDVRVGVTPDTQRRRRKSYPELYTTV